MAQVQAALRGRRGILAQQDLPAVSLVGKGMHKEVQGAAAIQIFDPDGSEYAITPHECMEEDGDGMFCEATFRGSNSADIADYIRKNAPLWHFCEATVGSCAGDPKMPGRVVVRLDNWKPRRAHWQPSWLEKLALDDHADDEDEEAAAPTQPRLGILRLAGKSSTVGGKASLETKPGARLSDLKSKVQDLKKRYG